MDLAEDLFATIRRLERQGHTPLHIVTVQDDMSAFFHGGELGWISRDEGGKLTFCDLLVIETTFGMGTHVVAENRNGERKAHRVEPGAGLEGDATLNPLD